jgi:hypothetical protein
LSSQEEESINVTSEIVMEVEKEDEDVPANHQPQRRRWQSQSLCKVWAKTKAKLQYQIFGILKK